MPAATAGQLPRNRVVSPLAHHRWGNHPTRGWYAGTEASGMRMNRPRTPPAALPDLTGPPIVTSSWRWHAAEPEPSGRLLLPEVARRRLGADAAGAFEVSGIVRGDALVLRPDAEDGRSMTVDGRGRIYLPVWLRRHPGFLIGTYAATAERAVVVVPAVLFDAVGDQFLARVR